MHPSQVHASNVHPSEVDPSAVDPSLIHLWEVLPSEVNGWQVHPSEIHLSEVSPPIGGPTVERTPVDGTRSGGAPMERTLIKCTPIGGTPIRGTPIGGTYTHQRYTHRMYSHRRYVHERYTGGASEIHSSRSTIVGGTPIGHILIEGTQIVTHPSGVYGSRQRGPCDRCPKCWRSKPCARCG